MILDPEEDFRSTTFTMAIVTSRMCQSGSSKEPSNPLMQTHKQQQLLTTIRHQPKAKNKWNLYQQQYIIVTILPGFPRMKADKFQHFPSLIADYFKIKEYCDMLGKLLPFQGNKKGVLV